MPLRRGAANHLDHKPEGSEHDLAQLVFQTDQAFGTLAARMAARGLVERVGGPGRAIRHRITAKSRNLLADGQAIADAVFAETFANLDTEQREQPGDLLDALLGPDAPVTPNSR